MDEQELISHKNEIRTLIVNEIAKAKANNVSRLAALRATRILQLKHATDDRIAAQVASLENELGYYEDYIRFMAEELDKFDTPEVLPKGPITIGPLTEE